jgi:HPt (histidine-containing phosphotransfer) domain-containing protein
MDRVLTKPIVWPELFAAMAALTVREDKMGSEPPHAEAPAASAMAPLLDYAILAPLGKGITPEVLASFLRRAVEEAERAYGLLVDLLDRPEEAWRVAHRLRGTAGSFGLTRISELAGAIEERVAHGDELANIVTRLGAAVVATRKEIEREGPPATLGF